MWSSCSSRGTEDLNNEIAKSCTLFEISYSQKTAHAPWTTGLLDVPQENVRAHVRVFYYDALEN